MQKKVPFYKENLTLFIKKVKCEYKERKIKIANVGYM